MTAKYSPTRFWLSDIWGNQWDRHRRSLLYRHFWSYLKTQPTPSSYLPDPAQLALTASDELAYSNWYRQRIAYIQSESRKQGGVYLTYRPLGKNLRLLGTALRHNVNHGKATYILPGGPPSEERALHRKGRDWSPWLWSRSSGLEEKEHDTARSWETYFRNLRVVNNSLAPQPVTKRVSKNVARILEIAGATKYAFRLNEETLSEVERIKRRINWPAAGQRIVGLHIRRGDAAATDKQTREVSRSTRASFQLSAYLETLDVICEKYEIDHVFIASESIEETELASRLRPKLKFLYVNHDRSIFPDISTSNRFIEHHALDHPELARSFALSAILDLYLLSQCTAFVGTFNSEFSVLAWLLCVGEQRSMVPYVSLSKAQPKKTFDPYKALLNIENNCPLELYHW